jgi:hypothetical protein
VKKRIVVVLSLAFLVALSSASAQGARVYEVPEPWQGEYHNADNGDYWNVGMGWVLWIEGKYHSHSIHWDYGHKVSEGQYVFESTEYTVTIQAVTSNSLKVIVQNKLDEDDVQVVTLRKEK